MYGDDKDPMCNRDLDDLSEEDYDLTVEDDGVGGEGFPTIKYKDGSSRVNFGMGGGYVNYDKFGEEC